MRSYATTEDVIAYRGAQTADALARLAVILPTISAQFRIEAQGYGKDLDAMIEASEDLAEVTKCLVVDASMQYYYSSSDTSAPMTQFSEAVGGYSVSGTYANAGGGLYSKKVWLKLLGVNRQKVGTIEPFDFGGACNGTL